MNYSTYINCILTIIIIIIGMSINNNLEKIIDFNNRFYKQNVIDVEQEYNLQNNIKDI